MKPMCSIMFQDYLNIDIPNFDGGMDILRTLSRYSMASGTSFDNMIDWPDLADPC